MPLHPSAVALDGTVSPPAASVSRQLAKSELPTPARLPLTQWNQSASVPPHIATASRFEELVAEADALLHNLKTVQPVKVEEPDDVETALANKRQQAASRTKLAIVRVRVSLLLYCACIISHYLLLLVATAHQSQPCFLSARHCTLTSAASNRAARTRHCRCTMRQSF